MQQRGLASPFVFGASTPDFALELTNDRLIHLLSLVQVYGAAISGGIHATLNDGGVSHLSLLVPKFDN
jgi:hypothetical protein